MRLIWKRYDSEFDAIVTVIGVLFVVAGVYGAALVPHALRNPVVWGVAAIPLLMGVMGGSHPHRQYQL